MVVAAPIADAQHGQVAEDLAEQIPEPHITQIHAVDEDVAADMVAVLVIEVHDPVAQLALPVASSDRAAAEKLPPVARGIATRVSGNLLVVLGDELADAANGEQQKVEERRLFAFFALE